MTEIVCLIFSENDIRVLNRSLQVDLHLQHLDSSNSRDSYNTPLLASFSANLDCCWQEAIALVTLWPHLKAWSGWQGDIGVSPAFLSSSEIYTWDDTSGLLLPSAWWITLSPALQVPNASVLGLPDLISNYHISDVTSNSRSSVSGTVGVFLPIARFPKFVRLDCYRSLPA